MEFNNRLIACYIISIFALISTSPVFAQGKGHGQAGNQGASHGQGNVHKQGVWQDQKISPNRSLTKENLGKHKGQGKSKNVKKMEKNRNPMAATPAVPHHKGIPATPAVPGNPNAKENVLKNRSGNRP